MTFVAFFSYLLVLQGVVGQEKEKDYLIKSIYFGGGSYYVDSLQTQELFEFIDSIPNIKRYIISIHSHTDNIGGAAYNEWLSTMRSRSTIQLLIQKAIRREDIEVRDFGQFNPVFDNSTQEGRRKNRRVDIIFWPLAL